MSSKKDKPRTIKVSSKPKLSVPRGRSRARSHAHTPQTISRSKSSRKKSKKSNNKQRSRTPLPSTGRPRQQTVPRKLGPRDIGRISYKGIKYVDKDDDHFLSEKTHRTVRGRSSIVSKKRAKKNKAWQKGYVFLDETIGPSNDESFETIKWPKEFKMDHPNEYWFDSPKVEMNTDLRKLIEVLPAKKKSKLNKMPLPKDHDTKIQFLKELRTVVMNEVKRLHIEDKELTELADEIGHDTVNDMDDMKEGDSLHGNKNSTMTLDVDIDQAIGGIIDQDQDIKETELLEHKYKKMLKRSNNKMGLFQRKLLTMATINDLTDLINNMEHRRGDENTE
eukprot:281212_1